MLSAISSQNRVLPKPFDYYLTKDARQEETPTDAPEARPAGTLAIEAERLYIALDAQRELYELAGMLTKTVSPTGETAGSAYAIRALAARIRSLADLSMSALDDDQVDTVALRQALEPTA